MNDRPLGQLSESKRALLDRLLADDADGSAAAEPSDQRIPRRSSDAAPPLSFAQERLWFMDRLAPGNAFYNCDVTVPIHSAIDIDALERTLQHIVDRHESLRTTFRDTGRGPVQVIAPSLDVPLRRVDLSDQPVATRRSAAVQRATELGLEPFDLEVGPLIRPALVTIGPAEHLLVLSMHHIISDGWSLGVLSREITECYTAFARGKEPELRPLPIQYADYAVWQREWLSGDRLDEELAYWEDRLHALPSLDLPTDRSRPAIRTFGGGYEKVHLPASVTLGVRRLANQEGATVFMVLLATFTALLARYSASDDIPVGSPIANRNRTELEGLVGFFVNAQVLRTSVAGDPTMRELVDRVKNTALDAYRHQDLPFERLVEQLAPQRDLSQNPLFQVIFQYFQTARSTHDSSPAAPSEPASDGFIETERGTSKFDLRLDTWSADDGIRGQFEYATDVYDAATIVQMSGHWRRIIDQAVADPDIRLSELELMSPVERDLIVTTWNQTAVPYADDRGVHQAFERHAATHPTAIAISGADFAISADELDARSARLAAELSARGVARGSAIGILLGRSLDHVVATLAILKAGGVYVPLDTEYPTTRLRFMIGDAQLGHVITDADLADQLPGGVVAVLVNGETIIDQPIPPSVPAAPEDPAYIMYTSGSTGTPKGILIPHRGIARLVTGQDYLTITPDDVVAHASNVSFDASTFEIWSGLMNGARLHVIERDVLLSPTRLAQEIRDAGITVLFLTTPLFQQFVEVDPGAFSTLRALIVGGSALAATPCRKMFAAGPPRLFANAYGPTENSTFSTVHVIDSPPDPASNVPIGRPINNSTAYILDEGERPVPIGVPGELWVGGHGLAIEYVGREELTVERFRPGPASGGPGPRCYRTGDRARFIRDGSIEFLGRTDEQVKIRGFRVELAEIEAALRRHPNVGEAVASVRRDVGVEPRLVAYVRLSDTESDDGDGTTPNVERSESVLDHWRDLYDDVIYLDDEDAARPDDDATLDISGWKSTYTGASLGADVMTEQVEHTVARIGRTGARSVLELGSGTGMILFRLAPLVDRYVATDFSTVAIDKTERHLDLLRDHGAHVELHRRPADDFTGFADGSFDAVVLNSVVQYFPSADYLSAVIDGAIDATSPGGTVFVGDVRNLALLPLFHTSVALAQAPDSLTAAALLKRIEARIEAEQELVIAPDFFAALETRSDVGAVRIQQKRGRHASELTQFRYDVWIDVIDPEAAKPAKVGPTDAPTIEWSDDLTVAHIADELRRDRPHALYIVGVPNARLAHHRDEMDALRHALADASVADVRAAVSAATNPDGVDPEDFWSLEDELPYDVHVGFSPGRESSSFDVMMTSRGAHPAPLLSFPARPARRGTGDLSSNPTRGRFVRTVVPELRRYITETLPEYMHPAAYVLMSEFAFTPNGKLDRTDLPPPDLALRREAEGFEPARSQTEVDLVSIWADILGADTVGIHDNFFTELGGNSLLATQVAAQVLRRLGVDIPLRNVFERPSVAELAEVVDRLRAEGRDEAAPGAIPQAAGRVVDLTVEASSPNGRRR